MKADGGVGGGVIYPCLWTTRQWNLGHPYEYTHMPLTVINGGHQVGVTQKDCLHRSPPRTTFQIPRLSTPSKSLDEVTHLVRNLWEDIHAGRKQDLRAKGFQNLPSRANTKHSKECSAPPNESTWYMSTLQLFNQWPCSRNIQKDLKRKCKADRSWRKHVAWNHDNSSG